MTDRQVMMRLHSGCADFSFSSTIDNFSFFFFFGWMDWLDFFVFILIIRPQYLS